jgi:hypothetical protein
MCVRGLLLSHCLCYGDDCNIDHCPYLCCFSRAPCECLSLLSCLSLAGEKCFAPLCSLVERFALHSTHIDDSDLNLSACIRMLVLARDLLCSLSSLCVCVSLCVFESSLL